MMRWIAALLLCALLAPAPALCASPRVHLGAAAAPGGRHLLGRHLLVDYTPEQTRQSFLLFEAFLGTELSSGCREVWKVRGLGSEHIRRRRRLTLSHLPPQNPSSQFLSQYTDCENALYTSDDLDGIYSCPSVCKTFTQVRNPNASD